MKKSNGVHLLITVTNGMCSLCSSLSLQDMALNPEKAAKEQEEEDAEEERKRENDDPEMLRRARAMDEFKDGMME